MTAEARGWGPPCPDAQIVNIRAGGRSFNVHRRVAPIFQAFVLELTTRTNYPIDRGTLDDWSYVCRKISGSTQWSNHAWGLAIDVNSLTNPMTAPPMTTDMPAWVRDSAYLLSKYGLRWGGTYTTRPDPMHYEFMLTPADADRLAAQLGTPTVTQEWWEMSIPQTELDKIQAATAAALSSSGVATQGDVIRAVQFLTKQSNTLFTSTRPGMEWIDDPNTYTLPELATRQAAGLALLSQGIQLDADSLREALGPVIEEAVRAAIAANPVTAELGEAATVALAQRVLDEASRRLVNP